MMMTKMLIWSTGVVNTLTNAAGAASALAVVVVLASSSSSWRYRSSYYYDNDNGGGPDYGNLLLVSRRRGDHYNAKDEGYSIKNIDQMIALAKNGERSEEELFEAKRSEFIEWMDRQELDVSNKYWHTDEIYGRGEEGKQDCHRPRWSRKVFPNCNQFHEIRLEAPYYSDQRRQLYQQQDIRLMGEGTYRTAYSLSRPVAWNEVDGGLVVGEDRFVLKEYKWEYEIGSQALYQTQRESIILEHLTSSPRIIDIYGHCGTAVMVEEAPGRLETEIKPVNEGYATQQTPDTCFQSEEDKDGNHVLSLNNLTVTEKLDLAIVMAESVADIHGYRRGAIVHGDLDASAWLRNDDGQVRLSDFNLAYILDWNTSDGTYCPGEFDENEQDGYYSLDGGDIHPETDTFVFGLNILYSILTGLVPFYNNGDAESDAKLTRAVLTGKKPHVDARFRARSIVESGIVDIMEQCLERDIAKRISIFDVVQQLYSLKERVMTIPTQCRG